MGAMIDHDTQLRSAMIDHVTQLTESRDRSQYPTSECRDRSEVGYRDLSRYSEVGRGRYSSKRFIFFLGLIFTRDIFFLILGSQNPYKAPLMQKFFDLGHFKLKFHKNS